MNAYLLFSYLLHSFSVVQSYLKLVWIARPQSSLLSSLQGNQVLSKMFSYKYCVIFFSQHLALVAMVTGVVTAWDLSTQKLRYVTQPQVPEVNLWMDV